MTDLIHLARAMLYRKRMWAAGTAPGRAQVALRDEIMAMSKEDLGQIHMRDAKAQAERLAKISIPDMPASVDDLALLIDTICMRHGYSARAEAWRHIGINPNRGRELLARNASAIDWPIWFTARAYAIGER